MFVMKINRLDMFSSATCIEVAEETLDNWQVLSTKDCRGARNTKYHVNISGT